MIPSRKLLAGLIALAVLLVAGCKSTVQQRASTASLTSGGSTGYIGQTLTLGSLTPGSASYLANYCTLLNFNNGNAGFVAASNPALITIYTNGVIMSTSAYELRWRYGGLPNQSGCSATYSATQKQYPRGSSKPYFFTVYFRGSCPPVGTVVELVVSCPGQAPLSQTQRISKPALKN